VSPQEADGRPPPAEGRPPQAEGRVPQAEGRVPQAEGRVIDPGIVRDTGHADLETEVVVVGGGGSGLTAAIAAAQGGVDVLVLEKQARPWCNTARSGGMIPAAGTRFQRAAGIVEGPEAMAEDILRKNGHASDPETTLHLCRVAASLVEWLVDDVGVSLTFVHDFKYPAHTEFRMHAPPSRTGAALWADLRRAVTAHPRAELIEDAAVTGLIADEGGAVRGVRVERAGRVERVSARKVILAANGFAANRAMLERYCPEVAGAYYFGGEGNTGEAIRWGQALGGTVAFMDAYQAHASVAVPHGILVTYALITEGGIQVNRDGRRFGDETTGYSEHALRVLAQPDGLAWAVYDERLHRLALGFDDYRQALGAGAVVTAGTASALAAALGLPAHALEATLDEYRAVAEGRRADAHGRRDCRRLALPLYGVKVTGALFHTQGGLVVDRAARVLRADSTPVPHLYAGGGTAAGLSGHGPGGYFSGNGLLTALGYGMLAGRDAARAIRPVGRETANPAGAGPAPREGSA
jgi:fumarate reductase flavoprotein subunit